MYIKRQYSILNDTNISSTMRLVQSTVLINIIVFIDSVRQFYNFHIYVLGIHGNLTMLPPAAPEFAEVTVVPVATAGPCTSPCRTIFPFLILLFFMTFIVAITQMPLLMIVLR